jgi:hypothetical protein
MLVVGADEQGTGFNSPVHTPFSLCRFHEVAGDHSLGYHFPGAGKMGGSVKTRTPSIKLAILAIAAVKAVSCTTITTTAPDGAVSKVVSTDSSAVSAYGNLAVQAANLALEKRGK